MVQQKPCKFCCCLHRSVTPSRISKLRFFVFQHGSHKFHRSPAQSQFCLETVSPRHNALTFCTQWSIFLAQPHSIQCRHRTPLLSFPMWHVRISAPPRFVHRFLRSAPCFAAASYTAVDELLVRTLLFLVTRALCHPFTVSVMKMIHIILRTWCAPLVRPTFFPCPFAYCCISHNSSCCDVSIRASILFHSLDPQPYPPRTCLDAHTCVDRKINR